MTQQQVTLDADVLANLHADVGRLNREIELLGSVNAEKVGADLVESIGSGARLVQFAMSRLSPQEIHAWPIEDLRRFAGLARDLPQLTISDRANHLSWVEDALAFAREAETYDRRRRQYEVVRSLEELPRGLTLLYVAHPVSAPDRAGVRANAERAERWLKWLSDKDARHSFTMPWLAHVLALDDLKPEDRARGMRDNLVALRRCDAIVLVGGEYKPGMATESGVMRELGRPCCDLLHLGLEPPAA